MAITQFQKPESVKEKLTQEDITWMKNSVRQRAFWSKAVFVLAGLSLVLMMFTQLGFAALFFASFFVLLGYLMKRSVKKINSAISSETKYVTRFKCKKKWVRMGGKNYSRRYYIKTNDDRTVSLGSAFSGKSSIALYNQIEENDVLVVHAADEWISLWIDVQVEKADSIK